MDYKLIKKIENFILQISMGKTPVVVFTKNFENNYACLELEDFLNLIKTIEDYEQQLRTNQRNN